MTIRETIRKGMIILKNNNITEPNIKARLIMQYILNKPREYLLVYDKSILMLRLLLILAQARHHMKT